MRASLSDEAIEDARAAADWYIDQGALDAADSFFDDIEGSIQLLLRYPRIGKPASQTRGRFPCACFLTRSCIG